MESGIPIQVECLDEVELSSGAVGLGRDQFLLVASYGEVGAGDFEVGAFTDCRAVRGEIAQGLGIRDVDLRHLDLCIGPQSGRVQPRDRGGNAFTDTLDFRMGGLRAFLFGLPAFDRAEIECTFSGSTARGRQTWKTGQRTVGTVKSGLLN